MAGGRSITNCSSYGRRVSMKIEFRIFGRLGFKTQFSMYNIQPLSGGSANPVVEY